MLNLEIFFKIKTQIKFSLISFYRDIMATEIFFVGGMTFNLISQSILMFKFSSTSHT